MIKGFDSWNPLLFPDGVQYAMLYPDGEFAVPRDSPARKIKHKRWITVTGNLPHAGITDFELGNPVYDRPGVLRQWASDRMSLYHSVPIVYCDRADLSYALRELGDIPRYWWIPTLDNHEWTPEELHNDILNEFGHDIPVSQMWGNQYTDHGNAWDESNIWLNFYL